MISFVEYETPVMSQHQRVNKTCRKLDQKDPKTKQNEENEMVKPARTGARIIRGGGEGDDGELCVLLLLLLLLLSCEDIRRGVCEKKKEHALVLVSISYPYR